MIPDSNESGADIPEPQRIVAKNLKQLRSEKGLTQQELAEKANIHRTYVGFIERAERKVSINILYRLADGLDVDVRELLQP
jgi:transcriptional regulator with XRE-family HTH domain